MQSEASPFIKALLTLTLGHLYCQKKVYTYFFQVSLQLLKDMVASCLCVY